MNVTRRLTSLLLVVIALVAGPLASTPAHAATGAIQGWITGPDGEEFETSIRLWRVEADGTETDLGSVFKTGFYSRTNLEPGKYVVHFSGDGDHVGEFYDDSRSRAGATTVTVGAGQTVSGVNAVLSTYGSVSGRVLDAAGHPIDDAYVHLLRSDQVGGPLYRSGVQQTGPDGRFTFRTAGAGELAIQADTSATSTHQPEFWGGAFTAETARRFTVDDMQHVDGYELFLDTYGAITVTASGPGGDGPVLDTHIRATLYRQTGSTFEQVGRQADASWTAGAGAPARFSFGDLERGKYTMCFQDLGALYSWPCRGGSGAHPSASATLFEIQDGSSPSPAEFHLAKAPIPLKLIQIFGPSFLSAPQVGDTITASSPSSDLPGVSFSYQWLRGGADIWRANGSTYVATTEDIGQQISLRVTATHPSWPTGWSESYNKVAVVAASPITVREPPTVSGSPQVGSTLTASPGTTDVLSATPHYQWQRDGVDIQDATSHTYTPTAADLGRTIAVEVTWKHPVRPSVAETSVATGPVTVGVAPVALAAPQVTGTPVVGGTLRTSAGTWPASTAVSFQWLRDEQVIPGAVGTSYTVAPADLGHRISTRVTGALPGHLTGTATSVATSRVIARSAVRAKATAKKGGKVSVRVTVTSPGYSARAINGTVKITLGRKQVGLATVRNGVATVKLKKQKKGKRSYVVVYSGNRTFDPSSRKLTIKVRR